MIKIEKTSKWMLTTIGLCYAFNSLAQNSEAASYAPQWGAELTSEIQVSNKGKVNFANLLRLQASLPVSSNVSFAVSSLSTYMTSKESIGGDLQTFSNLDAGNIPFALSVCGVNWTLSGGHELFFGVRNMNEDYFTSDVTSLFTNSSCGIFPTISANYSIANYPMASMGVHYKYSKEMGTDEQDALIMQASLYNGTGYNHFFDRENVFRICPKSDGAFALAQAEYQHKGSSYFLGACAQYSKADDTSDRELGTALWTYAEQRINDRLSLIAGYSHSFAKSSECSDFAGIGGKYSFPKCEVGIFTDYAQFEECGESATEVTCRIPLTSNIYIQPTAHAIVTSIGEAGRSSAFCAAGMVRFGISF